MAKVPAYGITQQQVDNALRSLGGGATPNYTTSYYPASSTPSYGLTQQDFANIGQNLNVGPQSSWLSIPTGQNTSTSQQNILGGTSGYGIVSTQDTINSALNGDMKSQLALSINNRNVNGVPPSWWEQSVDGVMNSGLVAGAKEMGSQVGDWLSSIWGGEEAGGLNGVAGGNAADTGGFMNQKFGGGTAMDWLGAGLQAFSVISAYNLGKDQIANARDALNASKEQFNKNFAMAINSYNTQLEDRWRSRSMMETDTALEDNAKYLNELNSQQLNDSGNRNGGGYTHDAQRQAVAEKQKTDSQIAQESKSTSKSATDRQEQKMAILEPKQVAQSDFSAGLRAFESGANMITAALDKAAKMPSAWQTQMRNYNENEAMQRLGQAKNMEEMYEAFRGAMAAGDTAYNNGFENKMIVALDGATRLNNQAATERAERDLSHFYTEIAIAQANGDKNAEARARRAFDEARARLELKTGLDYNPLKFKEYDYQANALGWANHGLNQRRLAFDMHDGVAQEQAKIALNQAKSNPNYDPEDPVSETNALYFAFEHAMKSGNIAAVNLIMDEINKSSTFDKNSAQAQEIYDRYSSLAAGAGQYDPSAIVVDPYTNKLGLKAKLDDQYATGVGANGGLTAASYGPNAAHTPSVTTTSPAQPAAEAPTAFSRFSSAVDEANKTMQKAAPAPTTTTTTQTQQPQQVTEPQLTPQQQAQKQAMQAADAAMQQFTAAQDPASTATTPTAASAASTDNGSIDNSDDADATSEQTSTKSKPEPAYAVRYKEAMANSTISEDLEKAYNNVIKKVRVDNLKEQYSNLFGNLALLQSDSTFENLPGVKEASKLVKYMDDHNWPVDFNDTEEVAKALKKAGLVAPEYVTVTPTFSANQYAANPSAATSAQMVQQPIAQTALKMAEDIKKLNTAAQNVQNKTAEDNLLLDQSTSTILDNNLFKLEVANGYNNALVEEDNGKTLASIEANLNIASKQLDNAEQANMVKINASPQLLALYQTEQLKADPKKLQELEDKSFYDILADKTLFSYADARDKEDSVHKNKDNNRAALIEKYEKDTYVKNIIASLNAIQCDELTKKILLDNFAAQMINKVGDNLVANDVTFNTERTNEFATVICNPATFEDCEREFAEINSDLAMIQSKQSNLEELKQSYANIYSSGSYSGMLITAVANAPGMTDEEFLKLRSAAANGDTRTMEKLMWQYGRNVGAVGGRQPLNDNAFRVMVAEACRNFMTVNARGNKALSDFETLKEYNYRSNQQTIFSGIRQKWLIISITT